MADKIEMNVTKKVRESGTERGLHNTNNRRQNHRQHVSRGNGGVLKGGIRGGIQRSKHRREDSGFFPVEARNFQSTKLRIGNLGPNMSEVYIRDLFVNFGALKSVVVHYDRSGRTLGTADVEYKFRDDALRAMKQYNGVPLDGRPMSIELAITDVALLYSHNSGRRRNPPKHHGVERISRDRRQNNHNDYKSKDRQANHNRSSRNCNPVPKKRKAMTAEELDAELDAYMMEVCEE